MQMQGLTGNSGMQLCYTCRGAEDIAPASSNFGCSAAPETTLSHILTTSCRRAFQCVLECHWQKYIHWWSLARLTRTPVRRCTFISSLCAILATSMQDSHLMCSIG